MPRNNDFDLDDDFIDDDFDGFGNDHLDLKGFDEEEELGPKKKKLKAAPKKKAKKSDDYDDDLDEFRFNDFEDGFDEEEDDLY